MKEQLEALTKIEAAFTAELADEKNKGKNFPHLQDAQARVRTAISATRRHIAMVTPAAKPEAAAAKN